MSPLIFHIDDFVLLGSLQLDFSVPIHDITPQRTECKKAGFTFSLFIYLYFFQGTVPFLVSCTAGTTVQGAFDPLDHIADVCEKHKLWMHVDVSPPEETNPFSVDQPCLFLSFCNCVC